MNISEIAKALGSRGGKQRAKNLSIDRRREIAKLGAKARGESLRLEKLIKSNFYYVNMIHALNPPPQSISNSVVGEKLPEIYEKS